MPATLTHLYKHFLASEILETIQDDNRLYFYTGVHGDVIGEVETPDNDNREIVYHAYHNMIQGKRVSANDVMLMVRNIPYELNRVFDKYDDDDQELTEKDFYCHVDEGGLIHTYKCLDNNFNAESTVEPTFAFFNEGSNYIFQTSDGYVWKYMYSITNAIDGKFTTDRYFPVVTNANVAAAAVAGQIDVVHIEQNDLDIPGGGKGYDNYLTGTFATSQLRINGNSVLYAITNNTINFTDGFYTGCVIYLSDGIGVGQYTTVLEYFHNSNGNFIHIAEAFEIPPQNGTEWEIYPNVRFYGSGTETVTAVARALVNSTGSNSVYKVEMLEKGAGYQMATANVVANTVVSSANLFFEAELRPILNPPGGHGNDAPRELRANALEVHVKLTETESNTILVTNRYQQIGLLVDPLFANVNIELDDQSGSFQENEWVYKINPIRINSNVCITSTNSFITGEILSLSNAAVVTQGDAGSYIPGDILFVAGGTPLANGKLSVVSTRVRTATVNNGGSGFTPGTFTANIDAGVAVTNAVITATVNSIGEVESVIIDNPGIYTTNPSFLNNTAPTEGEAGSGLTLQLTMGLEEVEVFDVGAYAILPDELANNEPISNVGTGSGAQVLLAFTPIHSADFTNQLEEGDYIYVTGSPAASPSIQQLAVVNSITNGTYLTIVGNGLFTCAMSQMFLPNISGQGIVNLVANATNILLNNVNCDITEDELLIGNSSGAFASVNAVFRNDVEKDFDTFIQMYKYEIVELSNNFIENEFVYQGDSLAEAASIALVHSVVQTGGLKHLYTSNQMGHFDANTFIAGANSLTVADINKQYRPELHFGTGKVIYIENVPEPVERQDEQSETYQIILTF